jgi:endonuclease-8
VIGSRFDERTFLKRLREDDPTRPIGDAILEQRTVAGIGNMWKAEALWLSRVSPWRALADVSDEELREALVAANRLMRGRLDGARPLHHVYRRVGRACHRCGAVIRSYPQGEAARTAYWCPGCQRGGKEPRA